MALTASEVDGHVGQRLRQRREALGISQGRLARHLGLTFSQVQKYEKGTNRIGAGRLFLLASFLGVSIDYFYEGLGESGAKTVIHSRRGSDTEIAALEEAFSSIVDRETRQSVLALVRSLAATEEDPAGRQRAS